MEDHVDDRFVELRLCQEDLPRGDGRIEAPVAGVDRQEGGDPVEDLGRDAQDLAEFVEAVERRVLGAVGIAPAGIGWILGAARRREIVRIPPVQDRGGEGFSGTGRGGAKGVFQKLPAGGVEVDPAAFVLDGNRDVDVADAQIAGRSVGAPVARKTALRGERDRGSA